MASICLRGVCGLCRYTAPLRRHVLRQHWKWKLQTVTSEGRLLCSTAGVGRRDGRHQEGSATEEPGAQDEETKLADDEWFARELEEYQAGKERLAKMMGRDAHSFTQEDVNEALRYLLPTRLSARDARPSLKHPLEIFPKRKESEFDAAGRPLEPAFFTGSPAYHNLVYTVYQQQALLEESVDSSSDGHVQTSEDQTLATQTSEAPVYWIKKDAMSNVIAGELTDSQYEDILSRLSKLASHPRSKEIKSFLDQFRQAVLSYRMSATQPELKAGKAIAVGKRKTSVAKVSLCEGSGRIEVNGRAFLEYFPLLVDRQQVLYPLTLLDQLAKFDVKADVRGGGRTGQAGAVRLAISKALLAFPGDHGDKLEEAGLLIRDPRMVERKKPGQLKARRKFAWVKR